MRRAQSQNMPVFSQQQQHTMLSLRFPRFHTLHDHHRCHQSNQHGRYHQQHVEHLAKSNKLAWESVAVVGAAVGVLALLYGGGAEDGEEEQEEQRAFRDGAYYRRLFGGWGSHVYAESTQVYVEEDDTEFKFVDVDQRNFVEQMELFRELLPKAVFVSFDAEFSGLAATPQDRISARDTIEERFQKSRCSVQQFAPLQMGLCLWLPDPADDSQFLVVPFNFNLLPERVFSASSDSLRFLVNNNFDLNHVVAHGISYVNGDKEARLMQEVNNTAAPQKFGRPIDLSNNADARAFVETFAEHMQEWCGTALPGELFEMKENNSFRRRLIYEEAERRCVDIETEAMKNLEGWAEGVRLVKVDEAIQEARRKVEYEQRRAKAEKKIGFRRIAQMLSAAEKPIVAHNAILDALHWYQSFEADVPETPAAFVARFRHLFPSFTDTKHIASHPSFRPVVGSTALKPLYEHLKGSTTAPMTKFYSQVNAEGGGLHQAAFDAYLTGEVLISLAGTVLQNHGVQEITPSTIGTLFSVKRTPTREGQQNDDRLQAARKEFQQVYENQLHLMMTRNTLDMRPKQKNGSNDAQQDGSSA